MKTLKFNTDSWHYKFIFRFTDYDAYWNPDIDLCSYVRLFFKAMFVAACVLVGVTLASAIGVDIVLGIVFSLIHGMIIFSPLASIALCVIGIITCAILLMVTWEFVGRTISERRDARIERNEPDGFVGNAYKSWKDKYCAKIEFDTGRQVEESPSEL